MRQTTERAQMAQGKSSHRDGRVIEVLARPSFQRMAIMAGVIFLVFALVMLLSPFEGHLLVAGGLLLTGLGLTGGGFYFLNHSRTILRLSKEGLYIQKFDTLFPWDTIEHATLTSTGARMDKLERSVAAIKSVNRSEEPVLLMIELTAAGRRQFKGQQFAEFLLRRFMRDRESICVWLGPMDCLSAKRPFDSREELVEAINDRARKYGHADQTTEPLDLPLGSTSKKVGRKRKAGSSQSKSKQGVTVLSTVAAVVVLIVISLGRLGLRNNLAGNANRNQQPVPQVPFDAAIAPSPIVLNGPDRQNAVGAETKSDAESPPGPDQSSVPRANGGAGPQVGPGQRSGPGPRSSRGPRFGPRAKSNSRPGQQTETVPSDQ